jgi:hypothetical protein
VKISHVDIHWPDVINFGNFGLFCSLFRPKTCNVMAPHRAKALA